MKSFADIVKGEPDAGDVHVATAIGNSGDRPKKWKPFSALISGRTVDVSHVQSTFGPSPVATATTKRYASVADLPQAVRDRLKGKKQRQWMEVFNSVYDGHSDLPAKERETRAFAGAWSTVGKNMVPPMVGDSGRVLHPFNDHAYHVPFPYDSNFVGSLTHEDIPRFLGAITHPDDLPKEKVKLNGLRAIQNRVNADDIERHVAEPSKKRPVIVRAHGNDYIGDGHDRLTARWLRGKDAAKVRVFDLDAADTSPQNKGWNIPLEVKKADPDQRMIFGWASIVTKDGLPIVDHQNEIIATDELEKAFYDYVLFSRDQGHMHSKMGVGKLIECMMFTKQKQDVLGIVVKDEDGAQIEGAWVGYYVDDDAVWKAHKRGDLPAFSIGGAAVPVEVNI